MAPEPHVADPRSNPLAVLECWLALKCYFLTIGKEDCPDIVLRVVCCRAPDAAADSSDEATLSERILLF